MPIEGRCRCGASRYRLRLDTLPRVYVCHCLDCQTWTGSAFSEQALIAEDRFEIVGPIVLYETSGSHGHISRHGLCGICHTRLYNRNTARPGIIVLRAGTLDDSHAIVPDAHIWTLRKQPWVVIPDGCPSWGERSPPGVWPVAGLDGQTGSGIPPGEESFAAPRQAATRRD